MTSIPAPECPGPIQNAPIRATSSSRKKRINVISATVEAALQYSVEEEKKAVRKLDLHLVTTLWATNLCSYLDRSNIGNAYLGGMGKPWGITSSQFSWLIIIFFIAYISCHWFILVWKIASPPMIVLFAALGWGAVSMLQATTTNFAGMLVCRFCLGACEAAVAPCVAFYMSFYYSRQEIGYRYGLFLSSAALASCFASALAYGLLHAKTSIQGWQLLFIVEGAPSILMAVIAGYVLPRAPGRCHFLTAKENEIIHARALRARGREEPGKLDFKQVSAAFRDYKNYLCAVISFTLNCGYNPLPAFLPTIIADIGIGDTLTSQGLTAAPCLLSFVLCIVMSFWSDRAGKRGVFVCPLILLGAVGYLVLAIVDVPRVRYFAVFLILAGGFPAIALMFTWVTDNQGNASKRGAGLIVFGIIGQSGSILGAHLFPKTQAPKYAASMALCSGLLFFGAGVSFALSCCLRWQNRARNKRYGKVEARDVPAEIFDVGNEHPRYRYVV